MVPVHLLRQLDEVPAERDRRTTEPVDVAREVDRERDHRERGEQQGRVASAPGEEVERPARPGPAAVVGAHGNCDGRDQQAGERVKRRPLRRCGEAEQDSRDQDVDHRGSPRPMSRDDEVPPRDDEGPHVHVVHTDPRLREHRAVKEHREPRDGRDHRRCEEPPREKHEHEREERGEDHTGDAPGQRMTPGLDQVGAGRAGDEELVVCAVDAQERSVHWNGCERRRAVRLDDDDPSAVERIEEVGARHDGERGGACRERPRARVGEGDGVVGSGLEVIRVQYRPVGARREQPVGALRIGHRGPRLAAGQHLGLLRGARRDHVDAAERVEDVQLAAVGLRGERDRVQRDRQRGGIKRRIDRKRLHSANSHAVSGEHQRPRVAERQGHRPERCVPRRFRDGHDDQRCRGQHDHVIALDRDRDRGRVA